MSVAELLELNLCREELIAHVDMLTLPQKADRPDPDAGRAETWPMIVAVEFEQRSQGRSGGFRSTALASTRSPVRLTATEVLIDVDRVVGTSGPGDRCAAVRAWSARAASSSELGAVADAAGTAGSWVVRARAVLEPRRWLPLRGATCPQCGHRQMTTRGNAGEYVVEPALAADVRTGIVACAVDGCGATWAADQLHALAAMFEQQTASEVLAVE